jgi:hypothetical protein
MTTTEHFQSKPEYYSSMEDCLASKFIRSNPRYEHFTQTIFHAGDVEQFETYRDPTNGQICIPDISLTDNIFEKKSSLIKPVLDWKGYKEISPLSIQETFHYLFDKFKKGIFIKIQNNQLKVFLPFSKVNFVNEWGKNIKVDPKKYNNLRDFFQDIARKEGRQFNPDRINRFPETWYGNNCLVRYEFPINEGDTGVAQVKDMFRTLCQFREIPDMEFFVNRRDYPLLKRDYTEPYEHLFDNDSLPLLSHKHEKYSPILSNVTGEMFADIPIPTPDDWSRISRIDGKIFPKDCKEYNDNFDIPWKDKKPIAVFRGSSTGCGVTIETNPRLKLALLSSQARKDKDGLPFLDAGITKWNTRPRKIKGNPYLTSLDIKSLGFSLVPQLTPKEQSEYKYIINIDGHVSAFRLSLELGMGSVILKVNSQYKLWFSPLLIPNVHYIPIKEDLSDLIDKIKWCKDNDEKCKKIAQNARKFYEKYLSKNSILDYLQFLLISLREETGIYLYNYESPLTFQINEELKYVRHRYFPPGTKDTVKSMPPYHRTFSFLQGTQWIFNYILQNVNSPQALNKVLPYSKILCQNTHSKIYLRSFFGLNMLVGKEPKLKEKLKESIHETFIGLYGINNILKEAPNFVYTYGAIEYGENIEILQEYISGISFFDYLKSPQFQVQDYLFILIQICLALEVAQNSCGFVHFDLFPWNIILQKTTTVSIFDYSIDKNKVYRIQSTFIPYILDYGKSSIIFQGIHHGFIKPYKVSKIQDVLSILISSLHIILRSRTVSKEDFSSLLKLSNFISNTGYNKKVFSRSQELKEFLRREHKFSIMLESDKYELENKTPIDLVEYIQKNFSYQFPIIFRKYYERNLNLGNSRQIFDFYLSRDNVAKIKSYTDVFDRLKKCTIPQSKNVLYSYFAIQSFYDNLTSVYTELLNFLYSIGLGHDFHKYQKLYENSINFLNFVYGKKLESKPDKLNIIIEPSFRKVIIAPYTQETFLLPIRIMELLKIRGELPDLGNQKSFIVSIFNNGGKYRLPEKISNFYALDLADLFDASTVALRNNYANIKTIETVSIKVYTHDLEKLNEMINSIQPFQCKDDFESAKEYMYLYQNILNLLK